MKTIENYNQDLYFFFWYEISDVYSLYNAMYSTELLYGGSSKYKRTFILFVMRFPFSLEIKSFNLQDFLVQSVVYREVQLSLSRI